MQGVETCATDQAPLPERPLGALPPSGTTTLYDVIAVLQEVVEPGEDALVVAIVDEWLRSGRLRFVNAVLERPLLQPLTAYSAAVEYLQVTLASHG